MPMFLRALAVRARHIGVAATALAGVALSACQSILDVDFPGQIPTEQLDDPGLAPVMVQSVIGDFECAFATYASVTSIHSDEFESATLLQTTAVWGERNLSADNGDYAGSGCALDFGLQVPMHTARYQANDVYRRLQGWSDAQVSNRSIAMATVRAYGAYTYLFFGETYCSVAFDGGPEQAPSTALAIAEQQFIEAVALAQQANATDILQLALTGLARVKLDLKKWAEVAALAQQVTAGSETLTQRGTESMRRHNKLFRIANQTSAFTVADAFRNLNDPRVLVANANRPSSIPSVPLWITTKYPALNSPNRLASYREAQLSLAEALAQQGQVVPAMTILNSRRAQVSLPALTATTQAEAVTNVIEERRRELSFEGGHRLNDLLRYKLPWKVGTSPFTLRPYGTTSCWPMPTSERAGS